MGEAPGTISIQKGMGLTVAAGNGCVHLLDVQMENKKRMPAEDFLRGIRSGRGVFLAGFSVRHNIAFKIPLHPPLQRGD